MHERANLESRREEPITRLARRSLSLVKVKHNRTEKHAHGMHLRVRLGL